ncbi:PA2169 family four-helix-bundle protein [Undibacterium sp. TJN25]|uniref:PA2169 family four-helix-bundle protein n=1 Tax=Undibacterium sp. TJN25 TaxID=3413056 RepID=UPI003BF15296
MDNDDIISTLNDLIETCKDGEEGFKTCVEDASDRHPQLKAMLADRQRGCAAAASELQDLVRAQGGDPETSSSVAGALHRSWVNIKTAITGKDDEAVLNECERGEDSAVRSYRKALEKDLPAHIRLVVERQYQGVLRNHDQIKTLRDQVRVNA